MKSLHTSVHALLAGSFLALAFVTQAQADNDTTRASDNEVWISGGVDLFGYKEPSPPPDLGDSERDGIPSIGVGVSYLGGNQDYYENLYFALEGGVSFGDAHYNGSYFYYPTVQLEGTTKETIYNADTKLGYAVPVTNSILFIPYGEFGYRYWDRNLGGGQVEDYQNLDILGGIMLQVSPMDRWILTAYGSAGSTLDPKMTTSGLTFDLGTENEYKVGGKIGFDLTQSMEIFTTLDYTHFRFGQSSVQDNAYEPNSYTNEALVKVGLAYHY